MLYACSQLSIVIASNCLAQRVKCRSFFKMQRRLLHRTRKSSRNRKEVVIKHLSKRMSTSRQLSRRRIRTPRLTSGTRTRPRSSPRSSLNKGWKIGPELTPSLSLMHCKMRPEKLLERLWPMQLRQLHQDWSRMAVKVRTLSYQILILNALSSR